MANYVFSNCSSILYSIMMQFIILITNENILFLIIFIQLYFAFIWLYNVQVHSLSIIIYYLSVGVEICKLLFYGNIYILSCLIRFITYCHIHRANMFTPLIICIHIIQWVIYNRHLENTKQMPVKLSNITVSKISSLPEYTDAALFT